MRSLEFSDSEISISVIYFYLKYKYRKRFNESKEMKVLACHK